MSGRVLFGGSPFSGDENVSSIEVFETSGESDGFSVETGNCSLPDSDRSGIQGGAADPEPRPEGEIQVGKKRRREAGVPKSLELTIEKFFKKFPCTPITGICKTQQWLSDGQLRYIRDNNMKYQSVMDVISNEFIPFTTRQFADLYRKPGCYPLFAMPKGVNELVVQVTDESGGKIEKVVPYYLSVDESVQILSKLLDFQTKNQTKPYLSRIIDICDKRIAKLNCGFTYGPPSSGKNFWFDCLCNFYLIRGQMMNINRNESFPYMDCVDKRIIMWNEPNICESPSTMDTLKMLFGGDYCLASVKYKSPTVIPRTPIFILTNDCMLFRNVPAFADRMIRWEWEPAPFLKDVRGYPHPLCIPFLLEKYDVAY